MTDEIKFTVSWTMSAVIFVKPPSANKISATLSEAFECVKILFPFPHEV